MQRINQVAEHKHKYERKILGGRRVIYYRDDSGKRKRRLEKSGGYEIFKCAFPQCKSYIPVEMAAGRLSLCWNCEGELFLTVENLRLKRPTHEGCRKIRVKKEVKKEVIYGIN